MTHNPQHNLPVAIPPANRFTILVVDDQAALRILICRTLDRIGYTTIQVANPIEAIELLEQEAIQPDLIISDVEMPEMTGIEMVREIRDQCGFASSLPIIIASGNSTADMGRQALDAGADRFMKKPFELADLYTEVGALLRSSRRTGRNSPVTSNSRSVPSNRLNIDSPTGNAV